MPARGKVFSVRGAERLAGSSTALPTTARLVNAPVVSPSLRGGNSPSDVWQSGKTLDGPDRRAFHGAHGLGTGTQESRTGRFNSGWPHQPRAGHTRVAPQKGAFQSTLPAWGETRGGHKLLVQAQKGGRCDMGRPLRGNLHRRHPATVCAQGVCGGAGGMHEVRHCVAKPDAHTCGDDQQ